MNTRLYILSMVVLLSILSTAWAAPSKSIYVYKDENGVLVFSDTPRKGAEKVTLNAPIMNMPTIDTSVLDETDDELEAVKFNITITSPTQEETIRDNTGSVHISGQVKPRFLQGHSVQLFMDGQAYGEPQSSSLFALRDVDRGEHSLVLKLLNSEGEVLASSKSVTFFMHRRSVITGP
ncbi:DUF4124 domain-containing protein [Pseudoalteromonas sp. T1lg75]|uniref:DUF4124 domain-containing protein n=1 Tax=Pseudoalteromonas sp. T1lg75 TaxID=2077102 RepID=UPI001F20EFCB|nr:DUF4124 domain-containing protein [Pseudoalteromonas sp. T1lg75]